jgi:hypothetical protein
MQLDLFQNEATARVANLPHVRVPQPTTNYLGILSAIAILVIVIIIIYIKYTRLHVVLSAYLRTMSVEWRLAVAVAVIWIVGSVIFMIAFSGEIYYRLDEYWMILKLAIIPPAFGIFSFWLIKIARRK